MSLPLTFRPKAVADLIEEENRTSLKFVLNKKKLFLSCMIKWYENLNKKQRSVLTKKKLIKRAIFEAHRLNLPSLSIPPNWMAIMVKECDLVCYISQRALERRQFRRETQFVEDIDDPDVTPEEREKARKVKDLKKFANLTSEEPPDWWTKSAEAGKPRKRFLALASTATTNIIYWDYDTTHWKIDGNLKVTLDPREKNLAYNEWENDQSADES